MRESKPYEAAQYLHRAVEVDPTSWRAHGILADAYFRQGMLDECIQKAERALELGHGQAAVVQPLLARALQLRGYRERAVLVLQSYLEERPEDSAALMLFKNLQGSLDPAEEPSPDVAAASLSAEPVFSMGARES